jgi:DNA-binding GntR family transcriptional regulator
MEVMFERLTNSTLRSRIAERLRDAIVDGTLKTGERIVERKLAAQFGASLAVVREAIIQLEAEGFITKWPNTSTHVTRLSLAETEKIFAVRKVLESFAAEEAARRASPQDIESLQRLFMEIVDAARSQDSRKFVRKDLSFHEKIWQITDNEYLQSALRRVVVPLFAFSSIRLASHRSFDLLQDANTHLPLLNAIKSKDPRAAREALLSALTLWRSETVSVAEETSSQKQN